MIVLSIVFSICAICAGMFLGPTVGGCAVFAVFAALSALLASFAYFRRTGTIRRMATVSAVVLVIIISLAGYIYHNQHQPSNRLSAGEKTSGISPEKAGIQDNEASEDALQGANINININNTPVIGVGVDVSDEFCGKTQSSSECGETPDKTPETPETPDKTPEKTPEKEPNYICHEHSVATRDIAREATCTRTGIEVTLCSCGDVLSTKEIPATGHSFGSWVVTTPATENMCGIETRTCIRCSFSEVREVPQKEHVHSQSYCDVHASSCTTGGWVRSICSCGTVLSSQEIPATGHSFGSWVVTTPATENMCGVETRTCTRCGYAETRTTSMLPKGNIDVTFPSHLEYGEAAKISISSSYSWKISRGNTSGDGKYQISPDGISWLIIASENPEVFIELSASSILETPKLISDSTVEIQLIPDDSLAGYLTAAAWRGPSDLIVLADVIFGDNN